MNTFYCEDLSGHSVILSEEDSKHAVKVLRMKSGDKVELLDGKGIRATGEIDDAHPKKCSVIIIDRKKEGTGRTYSLHIAIAPTKNSDRIEWFVEKAVEIGIDRITFLDCTHSERKRMNIDRIEKVAIAAMKQSGQTMLPVIHPMMDIKNFLDDLPKKGQRYIAHCRDGEKEELKKDLKPVGDIVIMIGPEGDFSQEELLAAQFTGFVGVSMGHARLRTETAALYAAMCAAII